MNKMLCSLQTAAVCSLLCFATALSAANDKRQTYPLDPQKVQSNRARIANDFKNAPDAWKNAPLAYYAVPPLSHQPRMQDSYPEDGEAFGTLRVIAARGEYEPCSLVVCPNTNANRFMLTASDLKSKNGGTIPASELDVKVVKIWYQQGSAWYGYWADYHRRKLVPELLLKDEKVMYVDTKTQDNHVLYTPPEGKPFYEWISAGFDKCDHSYDNIAKPYLIEDAKTFQPTVLNRDEFKQFMITVRVPDNAPEGIYTGSVNLTLDGKAVGSVPLRLRVLPFSLPVPKTNYNLDKRFYLTFYGAGINSLNIQKNLARHNSLNALGFPSMDPFFLERTEQEVKNAKEAGIDTGKIFSVSVSCGVKSEENPTPKERKDLERLSRNIARTRALMLKYFGHTNFYSYAIDEGPAKTIRQERNAWRIVHEAGGKIVVTTGAHRKLLFALDYFIYPQKPSPRRAKEVELFHTSNPDAICGWYADPHTGPENPDYFRRLHGFLAYKYDYDCSANYAWWRNNWNDWAIGSEEVMRGLTMVYLGNDQVIDTLAWEGVREGVDDVRYATKLKELAGEAMTNPNGDIQLLGRRALSFLAYADADRDDLREIRLETTNFIIQLQNALKKGK